MTIEGRQEAFEGVEAPVHLLANAAHRLELELGKMDHTTDVAYVSRACLEAAKEDIADVKVNKLLPIRPFRNPNNVPAIEAGGEAA